MLGTQKLLNKCSVKKEENREVSGEGCRNAGVVNQKRDGLQGATIGGM